MIVLPSTPVCFEFAPTVLEVSGLLRSPLNGETQQINRIGDRWQIAFTVRPMRAESIEARAWTTALTAAKRQGARYPVPLDRLNIKYPGSPSVSAATPSLGTSIPVSGLNPNAIVLVGQWLRVTRNGRRYLYQSNGMAVASASGAAVLSVSLPLRTALSIGDLVELQRPTIEGNLVEAINWKSDVQGWISLPSFTIAEAA